MKKYKKGRIVITHSSTAKQSATILILTIEPKKSFFKNFNVIFNRKENKHNTKLHSQARRKARRTWRTPNINQHLYALEYSASHSGT